MEQPASEASLRAVLAEGLESLGESSEPEALERWVRLALLLERWSARLNLTGHRGAVAIARRLLLESVALHRVLPSAGSIADLGSGAGIPGLPLALCRPGCQVLLVESRERRHYFQRAALRELGLPNVRALRGRAETLEISACDGVVSQAFAQAPQALRWMVPWAEIGGWVAIATDARLDAAALSHPELAPGRLAPYAAPGGPSRAAWIAERLPARG